MQANFKIEAFSTKLPICVAVYSIQFTFVSCQVHLHPISHNSDTMAYNFEVVISGISGRFPECDDIDTFKKKLYSGSSKEFITDNEKKWSRGFKLNRFGDKIAVSSATGKYIKETEFDYRFFKFNKLMGRSTDVCNRRLLEPSFEAIIDAGINPYSLDGANVGVFQSGGFSERDSYCAENIVNHVFVLGTAKTMGPNRLSYALNLTGPSYAFHSDPLGELEVLKKAKALISDGSIEAAIVTAVSNVTDPMFSYLYMYLDMLTPNEFHRSFDKNANGFVRSEGTVAIFLQRAQDAKRQYAKLVFCDSFFEGLTSHCLLGYDDEYIKNSLREIYERNKSAALAQDIAFMELTGCAIKKIEKYEANAVADVLCKQRETPLMVGSVKSNLGHTESASGLMSVLKALIALDSQIIAPNSNFLEVNDDISAFRDKQMQVVDRKTELKGNIVAVNCIGTWGTVGHALLQNISREPKKYSDGIPRLLLLSGRTPEGLRMVFQKIKADSFNAESIALTNDVFYENMPSHIFRGYTILPKTKNVPAVIDECGTQNRPICFIFSGMGSQWNGMGKELLDFPIIAEVIKRCDAVLKPKSIDIYDVLLSEDPTIFDDIMMSFVAIICMQIALVEVLRKLNIVPDLVVGHSVGENGCAYADGCLSLEQAVLVSYARGIASVSTKTVKGMMAAVGKGYEEIKDNLPSNIEVACHNAANSCTLSGPAEEIEAFVEKLKEEGVFARGVNVANIAYHSKYIAPAAPKLLELLRKVIPEPKKRSCKWVSSSVPESEWHLPQAGLCSAEYLTNNLLKPVLFEEATKHIPKDAICIEIAPHGLLQAILKRSLPDTCTNISLTQRSVKKENLHFLLSSIGRIFIAGAEPTVNNLFPPVEYPVSRGTPTISPYCTWFHGDSEDVQPPYKPAKPTPLSREKIVVRINEDAELNFLKDHQINERTVIPPAFLLCLVWRMLSVQQNVKLDEFPIIFEKVLVHKNVKISISKPRVINILVQASGQFEVLSRSKIGHKESQVTLTGRIQFIREETQISSRDFDGIESEYSLNADKINAILTNAGFHLGECFQLLTALKMNDSKTEGKIKWKGNWVSFLDSIMKFQMFSDLNKSKLCFLHSIRQMIIVPSVMNSQQLDSQLAANYDQITKCFQCSGIQIFDARWRTRDPVTASKLDSSLKIRKMRFVSYNNPSCQSPAEFIDLCLQISLESTKVLNKTDSKCYICDCTGKFTKNLRKSEVIEDYEQEKIIFCDYKALCVRNSFHDTSCLLLAKEKIPDMDALCLEDVFVLLIVSTYNSSMISSEFVTIFMQNFNGEDFILLKKVSTGKDSINLTNGTSEAKSESMIQLDLDSSRKMGSKKGKSTKYSLATHNNILSPENEPKFMSELVIGLPNVVMKNQDWGSYRYIPSNMNNTDHDAYSKLKDALMDIKIESIHVEFIRLDPTALSQLSFNDSVSQNHTIGIEFAGVNSNGQRLMGLTSVNLDDPFSKVDPLLTWKIPEEWTLAEAVSLPSIYAHVFHIPKLIERSVYMPSCTVLIIAGEDTPVVEICLSMCVSKNYTVYVAVSNTGQINSLRQNCPWFNESHIIFSDGGLIDTDIMFKTKGQGVNVVINYSAGIKNLTSAINCGSYFAFYVETVQSNFNEHYEIGMFKFSHSLCVTVLPGSISYLLNLHDDTKMELHKSVSEGIKTGIIRPRKELDTKGSSIRIDNNEASLNGSKSKTISSTDNNTGIACENLRFKHNHSHIILGGERSEETWINLIYWLKERKGTNFVVLLEKFPTKARISQQLNRLLTNKRIIISLKPLNTLISVEDAIQLIQETTKIAPVDSVFFISLDSSSKKIRLMDLASQQCKKNVKFVSWFSGGLEEMELRRSKGLPAFVLHGGNIPKNVPEIMTEFEKSLSTETCPDVLYQIIDTKKQPSFDRMLSFLKNYLPENIDSLQRIGRQMSDTIEFVEITSLSPRFTDCRGVLPIFMIPSLHASQLPPLLHTLLYPVFCASLSQNSISVKDTAAKLFEHLKLVQPEGPVTLIGETWSAAIAVELSSIIKQSGRDFRLFLLQGNPVEWKETIICLNLKNHQEFKNCITQIYGEELSKYFSISDQMSAGADKWTVAEKTNAAHILRCLNVLRVQFSNIYDYNANNANLENTVLFSKTVPQNITSVLSNTCDIIYIKEDNYEKFIKSPVISKKINKLAMFSWSI